MSQDKSSSQWCDDVTLHSCLHPLEAIFYTKIRSFHGYGCVRLYLLKRLTQKAAERCDVVCIYYIYGVSQRKV